MTDDAVFVLAIDLGTGGPKVGLVSATGDVLGYEYEPNRLILLPGNGVEQDPEEWWASIVTASRRLLGRALVPVDSVIAVSVTTMWMTTVAVGGDGSSLGNAISWMDTRGAPYAQAATGGGLTVPTVGYNARKLRRWLHATGGVPQRSGKDPVGHILFLKNEQPEIYEATATFLEPMDYINLRLTGRTVASTDSIVSHWVTDNRDLDNVSYDDQLVEWSGIDRAKLPELVPTGSVIGKITEAAASEFGLGRDVQIVAGLADTLSAGIGAGAVRDHEGHLYIGTSSWVTCHVPFKRTNLMTNTTCLPSGIPGRYWVAASQDTAGKSLSWLIEKVLYPSSGAADSVDPLGLGPAPEDVYGRLNAVAELSPPGSNDVLFLPWLTGERTPVDNPHLGGGWYNASIVTTQADLVRAVFEGVALNTRWMLDAVEQLAKRPFGYLNIVGGGGRSLLWCRIMADVLDRPIRQVADPLLVNVRGAGLSALVALGHLSWDDIPARIKIENTFEPEPRNRGTYDRLFDAFVDVHRRNKGIYSRLNNRSKGQHS